MSLRFPPDVGQQTNQASANSATLHGSGTALGPAAADERWRCSAPARWSSR